MSYYQTQSLNNINSNKLKKTYIKISCLIKDVHKIKMFCVNEKWLKRELKQFGMREHGSDHLSEGLWTNVSLSKYR